MRYHRILVPVDGSPTSNKALETAIAFARESQGRIRLVHALDVIVHAAGFEAGGNVFALAHDAGEQVLAEAAAVAKAAGVEVETSLMDRPGERLGATVAREAAEWAADLIVVGTHGRRGVERMFLGSGAEQIIRHAPVPVLVIRGEGTP